MDRPEIKRIIIGDNMVVICDVNKQQSNIPNPPWPNDRFKTSKLIEHPVQQAWDV
jgi:hypothetical protein